jgi:hypothetical protein
VTAADSVWAREGNRVLVAWPARFDEAVAVRGVTAFGGASRPVAPVVATVVAPFASLALPAGQPDRDSRVVARWNDGTPAAVQASLGPGCVRHVGIGIPLAGDITLREPFTRLLEALTDPCDGRVRAALPDETVTRLRDGDDPTRGLAPAALVAATNPASPSRLPAVLLGVALALLAAEQLARRRREVPA